MKKEKIEPRFIQRKLFDTTPIQETKATIEPVEEVIDKSVIDGWTSIYQKDDSTDRFVLLSPSGERYACKFYNRITNDFIGASFLAMVNLKEHFDRSIIPNEGDFNGK